MSVEELIDEVNAIKAIYPESVNQEAPQIYRYVVPNHELIEIQLHFPLSYPNQSPELLSIANKDQLRYTDTVYLVKLVTSLIVKTFVPGQVIMYELLTHLLEILDEYLAHRKPPTSKEAEVQPESHLEDSPAENESSLAEQTGQAGDITINWVNSDVITDRRSTFIAHALEVHSLEEAKLSIECLLLDKKVAKAAHNISSWRIKKDNIIYQDCDDDGETAAGGRLLHLLQVCISCLFATATITNSSADDGCVECGCSCQSILWWYSFRARQI